MLINVFIGLMLGVTALYLGVMVSHTLAWKKIRSVNRQTAKPTKLSVIVPFRNEQHHIGNLMNDLLAQNYPRDLHEIILINDHSTDQSEAVVREMIQPYLHMKLLSLIEGAGKKAALATGIEAAMTDVVLTTDADARVPATWLSSVQHGMEQTSADMLVMPVLLEGEGWFGKMQELEYLSLQGITGSAIALHKPVMASGANLAFNRSVFNEVKGYQGNEHIASGDDTFLLHKFVKAGRSVSFLSASDLWVSSSVAISVRAFVQQRIRWGGKAKAYKSGYPKFLAGLVFLINLLLVLYLLLWPVHLNLFYVGLLCFGIKASIDFLFLFLVTSHFGKRDLLSFFLIEEILYTPYAVVIPLLSFFTKGNWKDRDN